MYRRSLAPVVALLALAGCGPKAEQAPPPAPPPPVAAAPAPAPAAAEQKPCPPESDCSGDVQKGDEVTITVDKDAGASPTCVAIQKGKTKVVWKGGAGVAKIEITFKEQRNGKPENPECRLDKAECVLEKAKQTASDKKGFPYKVVAYRTLDDPKPAVCDPKLIVNP